MEQNQNFPVIPGLSRKCHKGNFNRFCHPFVFNASILPSSLLGMVPLNFLNITFLNDTGKKTSSVNWFLSQKYQFRIAQENNVTLQTLHCLNVILLNIFSSRFHCNKAMKVLPTFRPNKQTLANFNYFYIMQKFCIKCLPFPV